MKKIYIISGKISLRMEDILGVDEFLLDWSQFSERSFQFALWIRRLSSCGDEGKPFALGGDVMSR